MSDYEDTREAAKKVIDRHSEMLKNLGEEKEDKMTKPNLEGLLREIVCTDIADQFLVYKLEGLVEDLLEWYSELGCHKDDAEEAVRIIRASILLLQYHTTNTYERYTKELNDLEDRVIDQYY